MIDINFNPLEEQRARAMQTWMARPESKTLELVVKSMSSQLELEYLKASVETKRFDNKAGQAEKLLQDIVRMRDFLEMYQKIREQTEPFKIAVMANAR